MDARYHAMKAGLGPSYFEKLCGIASEIGMPIEYKATLCCAFAGLDQLERNLRGRAGC